MSDIKSPWNYFSLDELKCKCNQCGSNGLEMKMAFMNLLVMLRTKLDFPLSITSAYRCPEHNNAISDTGLKGAHTTGQAVDISISGERAYQLVKEAMNMGFSGIGICQKNDHRFIHLDNFLDSKKFFRPTIWSY